ncbi:hypothetical protein BO70DRAFT_267605, partial [Aspergillus heteromorphus CBS 117.55]
KRKKAIFDSDSDNDNDNDNPKPSGTDNNAIEISTLGGLDDTPAPKAAAPSKRPLPKNHSQPPSKRQLLSGAGGSASALNPPNKKPLSKTSIFADDSDNDETAQPTTTYGLNKPGKPTPQPQIQPETTNLSSLHSSRQHAKSASTIDPTIYSYDSVYDSLHAKPATKNPSSSSSTTEPEVPKYMTNLLRSAEIRKRDQTRARDRLLAKEREAEGDEFADKEKFVTGAYKAQQEELKRMQEEEEERERVEEERRRKNAGMGMGGMVGFYRDVLARGEERHEAVVRAVEENILKGGEGDTDGKGEKGEEGAEGGEKTPAQVAAELNAKGAHVAVNDDGQVVDKRQLLSAGLNVAPKPKGAVQRDAAAAAAAAAAARAPARFGNRQERGGQRARQTEMVAAQLEERARQEEEAEAARQKEIAERSRSRRSEGEVSSARERYLARKKEREAA